MILKETEFLLNTGQFTAPLGDELIGWVTWILRPFLVHNLSNQSDDYSVSHYATRAKLEVWTWLQSSSEFHGDQVGTPQHNLLVYLTYLCKSFTDSLVSAMA